MAVKIETGNIVFSYDSKEMFNEVGLLSAYMAKSWAGTGNSVDEFSITEDEEDVYNVCVKQALPAIHEVLVKLTSDINNAFDNGNIIKFSLNDNGAYNENTLGIIDATLRDCIKFGVLAEFYSLCLNADLQLIAKDKFNANLFQLKQRLFQLKRKPMSSII